MSGQEWIELLNLIPEDQHCQLNVMCRSGVELSIDALMRTERSFLVYRGRMVGTTDEGRVFFTPYSEITSIYLNRYVKEGEVNCLFEAADAEAAASVARQYTEDDAHLVATPTTAVPPPPAAPAPLVFPSVGKGGSGLVPRINSAPAGLPSPKPQHSSGPVPMVAASTAKPASFMPPPPPVVPNDSAAKGSILDRLRAQRSGPTNRKSGN
jgi:hypothetical protein